MEASVRVAIVDDIYVTRTGCADTLRGDPRIDVVSVLDHDEAMALPQWDMIDLVLLDAGDTDNKRDNVPGALVAERIRRLHPRTRPDAPPVIVVLTAYHRNPGVLMRMKDAGADYVESRARASRHPELLRDVVLRPHELAEPNPPPGYRESLGLRRTVDSNDVVAALGDVIERYDIRPDQLDPENPQRKRDALPRPKWHRVRLALDRFLEPRDTTGAPRRSADAPTLKQIQRFWKESTRLPEE